MNVRSTFVRGALVVSALFVVFGVAPAEAQTCGDANDDDVVTVTDGVQALRAAAGLTSACEEGCDVDASGAITVSDGVNILRKAAGVAIVESCEFTGQEANGVVNPTFSIFDGLTKVPDVNADSASAAGTGDCDNDGSIETVDLENQSAAAFTNCQIGDAILDGVISRAVFGQGVAIGFDGFKITRVKTGETHTVNGQLAVTSDPNGGKRLAGKLTIDSSKRGTFTLQFERIRLFRGVVTAGRLIYDLSKTTGGKIDSVIIDFNKAGDPVTITLRNQQVKTFVFDRDSRLLLPAV